MRKTIASRIRSGTPNEKVALAAFGDTPPDIYWEIVDFLRHGKSPQMPARAAEFSRTALEKLAALDADFFYDIARSIKFFEDHQHQHRRGSRYDELRSQLILAAFLQSHCGQTYSIERIRRSGKFDRIADRTIRRIAKEVGLKISGVIGRPKKETRKGKLSR